MENETDSASTTMGLWMRKQRFIDLGVYLRGPALMGKQLMVLRPEPNQLTEMTELTQDGRFKPGWSLTQLTSRRLCIYSSHSYACDSMFLVLLMVPFQPALN